jgi:hypothetical protein
MNDIFTAGIRPDRGQILGQKNLGFQSLPHRKYTLSTLPKTNNWHPSLNTLNWFQKNRALTEKLLSERSLPITVNVHRTNLLSQLTLQ